MSIKKSILVHRLIESFFLSVLKEVPEMSHFFYMVDSIKDAYFDVLVDKLYKVLNFVNIPKEEVRPIDIKKKLNSMGWCNEETTARYYYKSYYAQNNKSIILVGLSSITDYLNLMVKYLKSPKCACVANSRAELFKDYAVEIIENKQYLDKNPNKIDMDTVDDVACIFIRFTDRSDEFFTDKKAEKCRIFLLLYLTKIALSALNDFFWNTGFFQMISKPD